MSRIKLLQNKRDNQLKVLRKEIAQLLSSGQDTSAAIRVILCPQVPSMSFPFQLFHSFSPLLCCIWNCWSSIQQHIQSICPSPMRQAFCQSLDSSFVLNKKLFNVSLYLWSTDGSIYQFLPNTSSKVPLVPIPYCNLKKNQFNSPGWSLSFRQAYMVSWIHSCDQPNHCFQSDIHAHICDSQPEVFNSNPSIPFDIPVKHLINLDLCAIKYLITKGVAVLIGQVEHVMREQNTITAYDFIELYSELVVVRLPIIEKQRYVSILYRFEIFFLKK